MFIFLKNRHVYFIIGWLVALFVNTCSSYICELRWGMNTLVWSLTRQSGLESPIKRSQQFLLNDDILMLSSTSWLLFSRFFHPIRIWGSGTNTTWWTPAWCSTSHQMWRDKGALIVPILSQYYLFFLQMSKPPLSSSKNGTLVPVSCNSTSIPVSSSSQMYHLEI